jgi:restriction system protein
MAKIHIPTYDTLMNPTLQAIKLLGGSGTIEEIDNKVADIAGLSDEQQEVLHNPDKGGKTEVEYRLAWTRTYLKIYGALENSSRGVWALTPEGRKMEQVDPKEVVRTVRERMAMGKRVAKETGELGDEKELTWREELLEIIQGMDPDAFERLTQRLLRECGFVQVEVTGKSGDGGIDGRGILRLGGVLSFHVIFQCKRWKGSVGPGQIRDFRGSMVGRADKGLFITTGAFTRDAEREATRDGAPAIDLMNGDQLVDKLKELSLGVETRKVEVEQVSVERGWFSSI